MAKLSLSIASPEQASRFPRHGWAKNSQGVKLLWLPMLGLLRDPQAVRRKKGVVQPLKPGESQDTLLFYDTVRKLALVLRELHVLMRKLAGMRLPTEDPEQLDLILHTGEIAPLYLDLAYVYLLRLANRLAVASRLILFTNYKSAPMDFKDLRKFIVDRSKIDVLKPIADPHLLQSAFREHSSWFDLLSEESSEIDEKGIRDAMEHWPVRTLGGIQQAGNSPPAFTSFLTLGSSRVDVRRELVATLRDVIKGLCGLLAAVHASVGWAKRYDRGDCLFLWGDDDDNTGFWPEI